MADDPINDYLADNGIAKYVPDDYSGPATIEEYWAEQGLTEFTPEGYDAAPVQEEELPEEEGGFWKKAGHVYGTTVRGFTSGVTAGTGSFETLIWNAERKLLGREPNWTVGGASVEGILKAGPAKFIGAHGRLIDSLGKLITPNPVEEYQESFGLTTVPSAIGSIASTALPAGVVHKLYQRAGRSFLGRAGGKVTESATKRVGEKAAQLATDRGGKKLSESAIKRATDRAVAKEVERLSGKAAPYVAIASGATVGAPIGSQLAWDEAVSHMENELGRELAPEELDKAWLSYVGGAVGGLTEGLPMRRFLKFLDKAVPASKNRLIDALLTGTEEALQESVQNTWSNYVAAHIAKYDEGRELFEGAAHAAGGGGVAGLFMGLVTASLGRRARLVRVAEQHKERAAQLREANSPAQAEVEELKAQQIEQFLAKVDEESGANAAAAKEQAAKAQQVAAPEQVAAPADAAGQPSTILDQTRRFQQTPEEIEAASKPKETEGQEAVVAPTAAEVTAVEVQPEVAAELTEESTEEIAQKVEERLAKNVKENKALLKQAEENGVDLLTVPVGKKGKVTLTTLRAAVKEAKAAKKAETERAELADKMIVAEGAPQEVEPVAVDVAEGELLTVTGDIAGEGGAQPLVAGPEVDTTDPFTVNKLVPSDVEGTHDITNSSGKGFVVTEQADGSGQIGIYTDKLQPLGVASSLEDAENSIASGEFDTAHEAASPPSDAAVEADEASRTSAVTGEVFDTAEEARASEQTEVDEDYGADVEAEPEQPAKEHSAKYGKVTVITPAEVSDTHSAAVIDQAIDLAVDAYKAGAAHWGYTGDQIEIRLENGWPPNRGGPMKADLEGVNTIIVGVSNIVNEGANYDLNTVANEEIWHLIELQGFLLEYQTYLDNLPEGEAQQSFQEFELKMKLEIYDGMNAAEIVEVTKAYYSRDERSGTGRASSATLKAKEEEGGEAWDNHRRIVAQEYTRMRGQQAVDGRITEQSYTNREFVPALTRLYRAMARWLDILKGDAHWTKFATSPAAMRRVKETQAMIKLLSRTDIQKRVDKADKARKEMRKEQGLDDAAEEMRSGVSGRASYANEGQSPKEALLNHAWDFLALDFHTDDLSPAQIKTAWAGYLQNQAEGDANTQDQGGRWVKYWDEQGLSFDKIAGMGYPQILKLADIYLNINVEVNRGSEMRSSVSAPIQSSADAVALSNEMRSATSGPLPDVAHWLLPNGSTIDLIGQLVDSHYNQMMSWLSSRPNKLKEYQKHQANVFEEAREDARLVGDVISIEDLIQEDGAPQSEEHFYEAANRMKWLRVVYSPSGTDVYVMGHKGKITKKQKERLDITARDDKENLKHVWIETARQVRPTSYIDGTEGSGSTQAWSAVSDGVKRERLNEAAKIVDQPFIKFLDDINAAIDVIREELDASRPELTNEEMTALNNSVPQYHGTDDELAGEIRAEGFKAGRHGKVGGAVYLSPDETETPSGIRSQPAHFAYDKSGDSVIMKLSTDFKLLINGDAPMLDKEGNLTPTARDVLSALTESGYMPDVSTGTPEEVWQNLLNVSARKGGGIKNIETWSLFYELDREAAKRGDVENKDHDFKARLKDKGYEGISYFSGRDALQGRELAVFRTVEEHRTRNYFRDNLYEGSEMRSGVSSNDATQDAVANNGEAPVAPVAPEKSIWGVIKRMSSFHRWTMGGEDLLRRAGMHRLADSLREFYDAEAVMLGRFFDSYRVIEEKYSYEELQQAKTEFEQYVSLRERGPKEDGDLDLFRSEAEAALAKMSPATKELVAWQKGMAKQTGALSKELNVHVYDPKTGGWRPIGDLGEWHFPRMFKQDTFDIITNRNTPEYSAKYQQLLEDMVTNGNAESTAEAHESLQQTYKDTTGGDYFANLERARGVKLPDKYYETSVDGYLHFLRRFSERAAQIQAFGQRMDGRVKDAWDIAKDEVGDAGLEKDIDLIQKSVYRQRPKWEGWQEIASWGTGISSMLYLSGPLTSIRNLTSALRMNAETFGFIKTGEALFKNLVQSAAATAKTAHKILGGEWTAKFWKDGAKTATPQMVAEAHALGALRMDFQTAQLLDLYSDSPWYDSKSAKAKLVKGNTMALWMHGATERMGRSVSYTAALQWLRATREVVGNENGDYKRRLMVMKKLGFHTEADRQAVLDGDQRAVERFVRSSVREKQYSYDISQSPLFFASPVGRLFFQFQKWGFQRLRDLGRNVVSPALGGDKIYHKGKEVEVGRDFKPFIRMMMLSMAAGELYALLRSLLTDRERKEAGGALLDWSGEIRETYDVDKQRALALGMERAMNNFVLDGGMGIIGDYSQLAKDMSTRGWRYKNPLEPPTIQTAKELVGLITDRFQRGSVHEGLGDDIGDFVMRLPAIRQPKSAIGTVLDTAGAEIDFVKRQDAVSQVSSLRNAARRFADENELDENRVMNFIMDAKNPNSFLYDSINDALLIGDFKKARELRKEAIKNEKPADRKKKLLAIKTSVRNRQPLKVGGVENTEVRAAFYRWLKERRPDDAANMMEIQRRYLLSAGRAGLR